MAASFESLVTLFLKDSGINNSSYSTRRLQQTDFGSIFDSNYEVSDEVEEDAYENAGKLIGGVVGASSGSGIIGSFIGGILGKIAYSTVGKTMNEVSDKIFGWVPGYEKFKGMVYNLFNTVSDVATLSTGNLDSNTGNISSKLFDAIG